MMYRTKSHNIAVLFAGAILCVTFGCARTMSFAALTVKATGIGVVTKPKAWWHAGGDPSFDFVWTQWGAKTPAWCIPPNQDVGFSNIECAGVSHTGSIALGRSRGMIEVYRLSDGLLLTHFPHKAISLGWSTDGTRLAVLSSIDPKTRLPDSLDIVDVTGIRLMSIPISFTKRPGAVSGYTRFAISWSNDDKYVAVSTKTLPACDYVPQCHIINVVAQETRSVPYSDVYFLDDRKFVVTMNEVGTRPKVWICEIADSDVRKLCAVKSTGSAAGADSATAVFATWESVSPWYVGQVKFLPLKFRHADGSTVYGQNLDVSAFDWITIAPTERLVHWGLMPQGRARYYY